MADNLRKTIKEYKELKEQLKIITENIKELKKEQKSLYDKNRVKEAQTYNKLIKEEQVYLRLTQNSLADLAIEYEKTTGEMIDNAKESKNLRNEFHQIRNAMRELALAGKRNTQEFEDLRNKAVELQIVIRNTDNEVKNLAKNQDISSVGNQFKALGQSVKSLDFNNITQSAQSFANTLNNISWKGAVDGIKSVGAAFKTVGKALLTNPLFLIAVVIAGVIAALVKLMKEIGLFSVVLDGLKKSLEFVMIPLNLLIKGLKELTDRLGLTNNKEKEVAEERVKRAEKEVQDIELLNAVRRQAYDEVLFNLEQEMAAITGNSKAEVEERIRIQNEINRIKTNAVQDDIRLKEAERVSTEQEILKFEADNKKHLNNLNEDQQKFYDDLKLKRKMNILDVRKAKLEEQKVEVENSNKIATIHETANSEWQKQREERIRREKEFARLSLQLRNQLEDAQFDNMIDNYSKREKAIAIEYRREIQALEEQLLNITETYKQGSAEYSQLVSQMTAIRYEVENKYTQKHRQLFLENVLEQETAINKLQIIKDKELANDIRRQNIIRRELTLDTIEREHELHKQEELYKQRSEVLNSEYLKSEKITLAEVDLFIQRFERITELHDNEIDIRRKYQQTVREDSLLSETLEKEILGRMNKLYEDNIAKIEKFAERSSTINGLRMNEEYELANIMEKTLMEEIGVFEKASQLAYNELEYTKNFFEQRAVQYNSHLIRMSKYNNSVIENLNVEKKALEKERELMLRITKEYYVNDDKARAEAIEQVNKDFDRMIADLNRKTKSEYFVNAQNEILSMTGGMFKEHISNIFSDLNTGIHQMMETINNTELTLTERVYAMSQTIGSVISSVFDNISRGINQNLDYDLNQLQASTNERMEILNNQLNNGLINQEDYREQSMKIESEQKEAELKLRKDAFEEDKKMKLASATVNMLQGMVGAFSNAMATYPAPAGPIIGAAMSALVGVVGGLNIAKIKNMKFNSSLNRPGSGTAMNLPNISTDGSNMNAPQFQFVGQGNDSTNVYNPDQGNQGGNYQGMGIDITGKVVVSAVEINAVLESNQNSVDFASLSVSGS